MSGVIFSSAKRWHLVCKPNERSMVCIITDLLENNVHKEIFWLYLQTAGAPVGRHHFLLLGHLVLLTHHHSRQALHYRQPSDFWYSTLNLFIGHWWKISSRRKICGPAELRQHDQAWQWPHLLAFSSSHLLVCLYPPSFRRHSHSTIRQRLPRSGKRKHLGRLLAGAAWGKAGTGKVLVGKPRPCLLRYHTVCMPMTQAFDRLNPAVCL